MVKQYLNDSKQVTNTFNKHFILSARDVASDIPGTEVMDGSSNSNFGVSGSISVWSSFDESEFR